MNTEHWQLQKTFQNKLSITTTALSRTGEVHQLRPEYSNKYYGYSKIVFK